MKRSVKRRGENEGQSLVEKRVESIESTVMDGGVLKTFTARTGSTSWTLSAWPSFSSFSINRK